MAWGTPGGGGLASRPSAMPRPSIIACRRAKGKRGDHYQYLLLPVRHGKMCPACNFRSEQSQAVQRFICEAIELSW